MHKKVFQFAICALIALATSANAVDKPLLAQNISLVKGWNAFFLKGAPIESPDAFFANWPVQEVGLYDAAAFTSTRQFAAGIETEGVSAIGMRTWHRGDPDASTLRQLLGNAVYICKASQAYSTVVFVVPEAMRLSWHPTTDADSVLNYVGVSLASPSAQANLANYFSGNTAGSTYFKKIYGTESDESPRVSPAIQTASDSSVIVTDAKSACDWSGVLYVSPQFGVKFSTNLLTAAVTVRNDSAVARTVRLTMHRCDSAIASECPPMPRILWRDMSSLTGWDTNNWLTADTSSSSVPERRLEPGESWMISLALDRNQFNGIAKGIFYAGLLKFEDVDGGSGFATQIPISVISDGGETMRKSWPAGLWLCEVRLNEVRNVQRQQQDGGTTAVVINETDEASAGGTMNVRLPIHVDSEGNIKLVQRVSVVTVTSEDNEVTSGLYASTATHPAGSVEQARISSVVLPTDLGVLAPKTDNVTAKFGYEVVFDFTVSENSKVNPLRHALHPSHDGLRTDFTTPTPSGDDFNNYVSTVKPELFSIGNEIDIRWNENEACTWSPDETLSGTCLWTLRNLRHETDIQMRGPFTMRRVSKEPKLNQ